MRSHDLSPEDVAAVRGSPDPLLGAGKIQIVLRKQPDGSWRRVMDAWNSDGAT